MTGREVREYTNLSDARDKKWGSKFGKDKIDDEDLAFKRMVAKAALWGGTKTALDSDDLLYLKEQMEAEEDAERLRRQTEKRAFDAFKHKAASLVDALPPPVLQPLRVEPKTQIGIRQQVLVKSIVEVKPKRHRISGPTDGTAGLDVRPSISNPSGEVQERDIVSSTTKVSRELAGERTNGSGILGLAYGTSDDEEDSDPGHEKGLVKDVSAQSTVASKSARCGHGLPLPFDRSL